MREPWPAMASHAAPTEPVARRKSVVPSAAERKYISSPTRRPRSGSPHRADAALATAKVSRAEYQRFSSPAEGPAPTAWPSAAANSSSAHATPSTASM